MPVGFVHGSRSPMPVAAATDAADRIPDAWVEVVDGAGHFVWARRQGRFARLASSPHSRELSRVSSYAPGESYLVINLLHHLHEAPHVVPARIVG